MKRHLLTLVLSGLVGSLVLAGNAEACHKKKCTCAPAPCAVAVCAPAPCPAPAPVCEPTCAPKKQCGLFAVLQGIQAWLPQEGRSAPSLSPLLVRRSPTRLRSTIRHPPFTPPPKFRLSTEPTPFRSAFLDDHMLWPCVVVTACNSKCWSDVSHTTLASDRITLSPSAAGFKSSFSTSA